VSSVNITRRMTAIAAILAIVALIVLLLGALVRHPWPCWRPGAAYW